MRPHWIALSFVFAALATAQETPPTGSAKPPATQPADATAKRPSALAALKAADEAGRPAALAKVIDANIATGAVFAGQYDALKDLGWDTTPLLRAWLTKPPSDVVAPSVSFREACINALRDVVKTAPDDLIAELDKLATGIATPPLVSQKAKYALAQFGKTEHVDAMIATATKDTESTNVNARVGGWSRLADVYYNIRKYDEAAKAHAAVITAIEAVNPHYEGLPSAYYNCACSFALTGNKEEALKRLTKALELGKQLDSQLKLDLLQSDMDIQSLRGEPAFAKLMKDYFGVDMPAPAGGEKPADKKAG